MSDDCEHDSLNGVLHEIVNALVYGDDLFAVGVSVADALYEVDVDDDALDAPHVVHVDAPHADDLNAADELDDSYARYGYGMRNAGPADALHALHVESVHVNDLHSPCAVPLHSEAYMKTNYLLLPVH